MYSSHPLGLFLSGVPIPDYNQIGENKSLIYIYIYIYIYLYIFIYTFIYIYIYTIIINTIDI